MRRRAARRTGGCRAQLRNPATGLARVLHSISLNAMATPAARLPGPLVTRCRSRAVAKVDSIGLVVRRWIQCRSSSRGDDGGEGRATQRCGSPTRISSRLLGRSCCCEWVGIRVSTDTGQGALPSGGHDPLSSRRSRSPVILVTIGAMKRVEGCGGRREHSKTAGRNRGWVNGRRWGRVRFWVRFARPNSSSPGAGGADLGRPRCRFGDIGTSPTYTIRRSSTPTTPIRCR